MAEIEECTQARHIELLRAGSWNRLKIDTSTWVFSDRLIVVSLFIVKPKNLIQSLFQLSLIVYCVERLNVKLLKTVQASLSLI